MQILPATKGCFVCGQQNPIGLKLRLQTDGQCAQADFTPAPEHAGFKGIVHGGILSTLLDEVMVWACAIQTRRLAFCAELRVRFLRPVHPGMRLVARGHLKTNHKNRLFETSGELRDGDQLLLASATGKYLPVSATELARFRTDFEGDGTQLGAILGTDSGANDGSQ